MFFIVLLSNPYMTTGKTIALTRWTFVTKVMSLLFNMLSRLVIGFHPRTKCLLIHGCNHHPQWFWSPQKKVSHCFHCFPIYLPWSDGTRWHDLYFLNVELAFSLSSFSFIKRLFSSFAFCHEWCHLLIWGYWYFSWQSWFQLVLLQYGILHDVLCI